MINTGKQHLVSILFLVTATAGGANLFGSPRTGATSPRPRAVPATLADHNATAEAQDLLNRLVNDYGKRTWSGQQDISEVEYLRRTTGRRPLIVAGDFMDYSPSRVARAGMPADNAERLIALAGVG